MFTASVSLSVCLVCWVQATNLSLFALLCLNVVCLSNLLVPLIDFASRALELWRVAGVDVRRRLALITLE